MDEWDFPVDHETLSKTFKYVDGKIFRFDNEQRELGWLSGKENNQYLRFDYLGKKYRIHRLIYALHHKCTPKIIDHIDGDRLNNKIENLREATTHQNNCNTKINKNNKSGYKGVYKIKNGKWASKITCKGETKHLGCFDDIDDAIEVRKNAELSLHGNFVRV